MLDEYELSSNLPVQLNQKLFFSFRIGDFVFLIKKILGPDFYHVYRSMSG